MRIGTGVECGDAILGLDREAPFLGDDGGAEFCIGADGNPLLGGGFVIKRLGIDLAGLGERDELLLRKRAVRFSFGGSADVEFLRGHGLHVWVDGRGAASVLSYADQWERARFAEACESPGF
jgi:hypothetical protein